MLFSHHFASVETMNRARFWLTWHGFTVQEVRPTDPATIPSPRLAVHVTLAQAAAARALIGSIEHTDAPASLSLSQTPAAQRWYTDDARTTSAVGSSQPSGTPIHWHSRDDANGDPTAARVAEYMFGHHE